MKNYILFKIKKEALDIERLFFCSKFGFLIKMLLLPVTSTNIVIAKAPTYNVINLDLSEKYE